MFLHILSFWNFSTHFSLDLFQEPYLGFQFSFPRWGRDGFTEFSWLRNSQFQLQNLLSCNAPCDFKLVQVWVLLFPYLTELDTSLNPPQTPIEGVQVCSPDIHVPEGGVQPDAHVVDPFQSLVIPYLHDKSCHTASWSQSSFHLFELQRFILGSGTLLLVIITAIIFFFSKVGSLTLNALYILSRVQTLSWSSDSQHYPKVT